MITYSAAICAWDKVKQPGLAMVLLLGLEPNVVTYSTASSAGDTANQPDRRWIHLQCCDQCMRDGKQPD